MRCIQSACFTRVFVDGVDEVEVAHLHAIEERIRACLPHASETHRHYIGNALLNLAIARMLSAPTHNERDIIDFPRATSRID